MGALYDICDVVYVLDSGVEISIDDEVYVYTSFESGRNYMGTVIYRGSTPTVKFKPLGDLSVTDLGTPSIAIAQELVFLNPEVTVNASENYISAKLTEAETLQLVSGVPTTAQAIWKLGETDIFRFPTHELTVAETIVEEFESPVTPTPPSTPVNLHPFAAQSPFDNIGYWMPNLDPFYADPDPDAEIDDDDEPEVTPEFSAVTQPWSSFTDGVTGQLGGVLSLLQQNESLVITPLSVASLAVEQNYYLWLTWTCSMTSQYSNPRMVLTLKTDGGLLDIVSSPDSIVIMDPSMPNQASINIPNGNGQALFYLRSADNILNSPLLNMELYASNVRAGYDSKFVGTFNLGGALYEEVPEMPESWYRRHIPYEEVGI